MPTDDVGVQLIQFLLILCFIPTNSWAIGNRVHNIVAITENLYHQQPERNSHFSPFNIIYKRSGLRKVAVDLVMATERSGSLAPVMEIGRKHYFVVESMYKYLQIHIEVSNCVLVKVPINNYNYEQLIALFVILLAKTLSPWCN